MLRLRSAQTEQIKSVDLREVGSFRCPVLRAFSEEVRGVLLPGPPGGRWNPLLLPGGVRPRYLGVTLGREALSYAAIASASLSLALVYGPSRWSHSEQKAAPFNTRRSWFGPVRGPRRRGSLVEPPGTAPGSAASIIRRRLSP
ncbi:hypothetical protein SPHINGO361_100309 [Sphingomonas sp. EC-HK361]|nr:hypothetical protein SPHINGO361_100309 [Sphingomonas sp. EC-HK361]